MNVTNLVLLALSILLETTKNVLSNNFSNTYLKSDTDIYKFNVFSYLGSFLVLLCFPKSETSLFTVITALLFAVALNLNQVFFLKALSCGTMSFTSFIQGSGLIISTAFGIILCKENLKLLQVAMLLLFIFSMALALDVKKGAVNKKWLLFASLSMVFMGCIGIMQTYHQTSDYHSELASFLRLAFLFSALINIPLWKGKEVKEKSCFSIKSKAFWFAMGSGAFMGAVHMINLYLSGKMPKIFFFPAVNGGLIFVTLIAGIIFFKERLNKTQIIGIILGTIALSFIGL